MADDGRSRLTNGPPAERLLIVDRVAFAYRDYSTARSAGAPAERLDAAPIDDWTEAAPTERSGHGVADRAGTGTAERFGAVAGDDSGTTTVHASSPATAARPSLPCNRSIGASSTDRTGAGTIHGSGAVAATQSSSATTDGADGAGAVPGERSNGATANRVLHGLSFDLDTGELVCILGPSGCGKSTLVQLVAGFLTPTEGSITMNGARLTGPGTDRALVPQQTTLYPWLNVIQNVALPLRVQRVGYADRMRRAEAALAMVGLAHVRNELPGQLSGGMQQRVMVARAMVQEAKLLLMDEPFGALDALTRERLQRELLRVWRETGLTILLITHDVDEAVLLATRALVMGTGPGRIIAALDLDFGRQLADGHGSIRIRAIRSSPAFTEAGQYLREQLGA